MVAVVLPVGVLALLLADEVTLSAVQESVLPRTTDEAHVACQLVVVVQQDLVAAIAHRFLNGSNSYVGAGMLLNEFPK